MTKHFSLTLFGVIIVVWRRREVLFHKHIHITDLQETAPPVVSHCGTPTETQQFHSGQIRYEFFNLQHYDKHRNYIFMLRRPNDFKIIILLTVESLLLADYNNRAEVVMLTLAENEVDSIF